MTLPSSGKLSLSDIIKEFEKGNSLSDYYGVADGIPTSGKLSLKDFYGKSADTFVGITKYVTARQPANTILNLADLFSDAEWSSTTPKRVIINPDVVLYNTIGHQSATVPAISVYIRADKSVGFGGSKTNPLIVHNKGKVFGLGGDAICPDGGHAFWTEVPTTFINSGLIAAGGGRGGAGGDGGTGNIRDNTLNSYPLTKGNVTATTSAYFKTVTTKNGAVSTLTSQVIKLPSGSDITITKTSTNYVDEDNIAYYRGSLVDTITTDLGNNKSTIENYYKVQYYSPNIIRQPDTGSACDENEGTLWITATKPADPDAGMQMQVFYRGNQILAQAIPSSQEPLFHELDGWIYFRGDFVASETSVDGITMKLYGIYRIKSDTKKNAIYMGGTGGAMRVGKGYNESAPIWGNPGGNNLHSSAGKGGHGGDAGNWGAAGKDGIKGTDGSTGKGKDPTLGGIGGAAIGMGGMITGTTCKLENTSTGKVYGTLKKVD